MTDTDAAARFRVATLQDVANEAGVSLATASRVLNGSPRRVADSYRERVETAATLLGYTANISAQATARGTSATVALIVADIADPYFGGIAAGVATAAEETGVVMTLTITGRDPNRELQHIRTLRGQRPRGVILATSRDTESDTHALVSEIAAVRGVGGQVVILGADLPESRSVLYDNEAGAFELGARIAELGYRRAIALAGPQPVRALEERVTGFSAGFLASGGENVRIVRGAVTRDAGYDLTLELLGEGIDTGTLIFGASDVIAFGAMSALRASGRTPGSDVAVAGFGDIDTGRDIIPGLTTVRLPLEQLGRNALEAVLAEEWEQPDTIPVEVIVRGSTPGR